MMKEMCKKSTTTPRVKDHFIILSLMPPKMVSKPTPKKLA